MFLWGGRAGRGKKDESTLEGGGRGVDYVRPGARVDGFLDIFPIKFPSSSDNIDMIVI